MALNLQDKQAIVAEVSEVAKGALSAVVADSRGSSDRPPVGPLPAAGERGATSRA